jgi:uncharacterized membrane protein YeaQ/YmgE (transglycosylase-associated protein family)
MKQILPGAIGAIAVVLLVLIEPAAEKKGYGKLVAILRSAIVLGLICGYIAWWIKGCGPH